MSSVVSMLCVCCGVVFENHTRRTALTPQQRKKVPSSMSVLCGYAWLSVSIHLYVLLRHICSVYITQGYHPFYRLARASNLASSNLAQEILILQ